jgi:ABC-type multidrug transport system fused ATPase/permease subunit
MNFINKLANYLFIFIGYFFFLASIGVILEGHWIVAIFLFFIGYAAKTIGSKRKELMKLPINQSGITIVQEYEEQKEFTRKLNNFYYSRENIQRKVFQTLETIEIIETTKNLDTLISRYDFLNKVYVEVKFASIYPNYVPDFQIALDNYKQMYYDKIPSQTQLTAIVKPNDFDMKTFYSEAIYNCFIRNYEFQIQQIELLKTENGKKGRYIKLQENASTSVDLILKNCADAENFHELQNKLREIEKDLRLKTL